MDGVARVVLACDDPGLAEEVMHFLDRTGRASVVATAADPRQLADALRQAEPDAVVSTSGLAIAVPRHSASALFVIDSAETVVGLRAALTCGADGFFVWPAERDAFVAAVVAAATRGTVVPLPDTARIVAVTGSRGGAGATFLATHLADAWGRRGLRSVLADLDPVFGEVGMALGAQRDADARGVEHLVPVIDELTPAHVEDVLWEHPRGFRVLLGPKSSAAPSLRAEHHPALIRALTPLADVLVVHVPRSIVLGSSAILSAADHLLCALLLDVMSFACARRLLDALEETSAPQVELVINRAARAELVPGDVARVFGRSPAAIIPEDSAVASAQDRGRLVPPRSRPARAVARLSDLLLDVKAHAA